VLHFDGAPVRVWIQDESGRINVNAASRDVLQSLFVSAGAEKDAAGSLADRIVARRQPADPATPAPSSVTFHTSDELLAVPGLSRALYARILPVITVYGRSAEVNTAVAPRAVLLALPGAMPGAVDDLLRDRDAQRAANPPAAALAAPGATFTITAQSQVDGARTIRVAVVQFTGDETKPYWFLSWQ
jgi:general secretion pathway protein K